MNWCENQRNRRPAKVIRKRRDENQNRIALDESLRIAPSDFYSVGASQELLGQEARRIRKEDPVPDNIIGSYLDVGAPPLSMTATSTKDMRETPEGLDIPKDNLIDRNGSDEIIVFGRVTYRDTLGGKYCTPFLMTRDDSKGRWIYIQRLVTGFTVNDLCPQGTDIK